MTSLSISHSPQKAERQAVISRCLPFAIFMGLLALRGLVGNALEGTASLNLPWLYAVQAGCAAIALLALRGQYGELREVPHSPAALLASVGVGLLVFWLWVLPVPAWMRLGETGVAFLPVDGLGATRWDLVLVRTLGAVVVVPIMEELFWRSFLMRWIDKRGFLNLPPASVSYLGVFLSSAVFALAHELWAAGFLAGLAYALLYRHLGKLWYPIVAHATTNLALAIWVVAGRHWDYW